MLKALLIVLLVPGVSIGATLTHCSWEKPGANPYTGSTEEALARFAIPSANKKELLEKIKNWLPDERFEIGKGRVESGNYTFSPLVLMHFGDGDMCWGVDTSTWRANHVERGNLYCSGVYCVGVPDVCGNVTQLLGKRDKKNFTDYASNVYRTEIHHVPEPGTFLLVALGMTILVWRRNAN